MLWSACPERERCLQFLMKTTGELGPFFLIFFAGNMNLELDQRRQYELTCGLLNLPNKPAMAAFLAAVMAALFRRSIFSQNFFSSLVSFGPQDAMCALPGDFVGYRALARDVGWQVPQWSVSYGLFPFSEEIKGGRRSRKAAILRTAKFSVLLVVQGNMTQFVQCVTDAIVQSVINITVIIMFVSS